MPVFPSALFVCNSSKSILFLSLSLSSVYILLLLLPTLFLSIFSTLLQLCVCVSTVLERSYIRSSTEHTSQRSTNRDLSERDWREEEKKKK